jgi:hypothetical protein
MNARPPDTLAIAIQDNCDTLEQSRLLLALLDDDDYGRKHPFCFHSSIGGHYRHVLDHYFSFLKGGVQGIVSYEARDRDPRLETESAYASRRAQEVCEALRSLNRQQLRRPLLMRSEFGRQAEEQSYAPSSQLRELEFLLSHTVHHFALIGAICGVEGIELPPDFGLAPSTLRHRAALAAAATQAALAGA